MRIKKRDTDYVKLVDRHMEAAHYGWIPNTYVYKLDSDSNWFPDPRMSVVPVIGNNPMDTLGDEGMVAFGGDLSVSRLLTAYKYGFFPWGTADNPERQWHCPLMRFVLFPEEVHISHSMRTLLNKDKYYATFNRNFESVIRNCSEVDGRNKEAGYWLGDDHIEAYTALHKIGAAASVEIWEKGRPEEAGPVGGLYGVISGNSFIGESMFSLVPSGSKMALIALCGYMKGKGGLIDLQIHTPHLESMGGRYITYSDYIRIVNPEAYNDNLSLRYHPCFTFGEREAILDQPSIFRIDPTLHLIPIGE